MTKDPPSSEEVFFTAPPSQLFEVQLLHRRGLGPVLTLGAFLFLMFSLIVVSNLAGERSDFGREELIWTLILCAGLAFGGSVLVFSLDRGRQRSGTLRLDPDAIRWHWPGAQNVKLPYSDLWSAQCVGNQLVLQGKKSSIVLPAGGFADPSAVETILNDISTRIGELPDGARLQAELNTRRTVATPTRRRATVSGALAVVLALVFVIEVAAGALSDPERLLALGANSFVLPVLVVDNVDHAGHLGGFAAGFLISLVSLRGTDLLGLPARHRVFFRLAAGCLVLIFLAAGMIAQGR